MTDPQHTPTVIRVHTLDLAVGDIFELPGSLVRYQIVTLEDAKRDGSRFGTVVRVDIDSDILSGWRFPPGSIMDTFLVGGPKFDHIHQQPDLIEYTPSIGVWRWKRPAP
jgi:hypothetical protein